MSIDMKSREKNKIKINILYVITVEEISKEIKNCEGQIITSNLLTYNSKLSSDEIEIGGLVEKLIL